MNVRAVIHTQFGGFHIEADMAYWLEKNRFWTIDEDFDPNLDYPLTTLFDFDRRVYSPHQNKFEFRSHPDLIDCVTQVKNINQYVKNNLKIVIVEIDPQIEDYHDGKERITCNCSVVSED